MRHLPYPNYKNSGVDWIGEIPQLWGIEKLKYAANIFASNVDKKTIDGQSLVNLCNYTDVYYNERIESKINFMEASATEEQINKFALKKNDVIITKDSETPDDIGIAAYVPKDIPGVICGYHLSIIRPKNKNSGAFIKRLFDSNYVKSKFETLANGVTRYGLSSYAIDNLYIPLPPGEEQQKIVIFLDRETAKIDELIDKQEKLIESLEEKKHILILEVMSAGLDKSAIYNESPAIFWAKKIPKHWEQFRAKFIFEIKKRIAGELGYKVLSITQRGIKVKDIESNEGQLSMDYSKYQIVEQGDFAMNHMDLLTGYVDIATELGVTSPDYRVFSIKDMKRFVPDFYLLILQLCYKSRLFYPFGQGAAQLGRWRLPTDAFNNFILPVPPVNEQMEICRVINQQNEKIDALIEKVTIGIELLKEHRSSLISAAVMGKIDVRNE